MTEGPRLSRRWKPWAMKKGASIVVFESSWIVALPRPGNRRLRLLSALRAHTKPPYKIDFRRKTRRALNRPQAARAAWPQRCGSR